MRLGLISLRAIGAVVTNLEATGEGGAGLSGEGTYCYFEKINCGEWSIEVQKGSRETC